MKNHQGKHFKGSTGTPMNIPKSMTKKKYPPSKKDIFWSIQKKIHRLRKLQEQVYERGRDIEIERLRVEARKYDAPLSSKVRIYTVDELEKRNEEHDPSDK